jgi:hypothetical protein
MKTRSFLSVICCLALTYALGGCSDPEITVSEEHEVLFEVNYTNHAWGHQNKGFLIDKAGRIRTYDNPKDWKTSFAGAPLTNADMDENLSKTVISKHTVSETELSKYVNISVKVSDSDFSKPVNRGADMGGTSLFIYRFDAATKTYTTVLLQEKGDNDIFNNDPDAKQIAEWLEKVSEEVYK